MGWGLNALRFARFTLNAGRFSLWVGGWVLGVERLALRALNAGRSLLPLAYSLLPPPSLCAFVPFLYSLLPIASKLTFHAQTPYVFLHQLYPLRIQQVC